MECSLDPELYQRHRLTAEEREQFRTEVSVPPFAARLITVGVWAGL